MHQIQFGGLATPGPAEKKLAALPGLLAVFRGDVWVGKEGKEREGVGKRSKSEERRRKLKGRGSRNCPKGIVRIDALDLLHIGQASVEECTN